MLKFHQFHSPEKIPEGIRISLENHSSLTGNSKKNIFLNGKPLKKQKIKNFFRNFPNFFLWRSPVIRIVTKTLRSALRSQNVLCLVKIERGFDENECNKHRSLKKRKSNIAFWAWENLILRQKFFLKNLTMPKTVKGGPWRYFNIHFVAKVQKTEGRPFGVFRKFFEK